MIRKEKYEIYNPNTGEVYTWGNNSYTAMCNLFALKKQYGDKNVAVRWVEN